MQKFRGLFVPFIFIFEQVFFENFARAIAATASGFYAAEIIVCVPFPALTTTVGAGRSLRKRTADYHVIFNVHVADCLVVQIYDLIPNFQIYEQKKQIFFYSKSSLGFLGCC